MLCLCNLSAKLQKKNGKALCYCIFLVTLHRISGNTGAFEIAMGCD